MDTSHGAPQSETKKAAVGGLAVVGFVALILIGIATAIYAASYLPKAIGHLSSANVYLSSLVQPGSAQPDANSQQIPQQPTYQPTYTPPAATSSQPSLPVEQPVTQPTYTPPTTVTQPTTPKPTTPTYYTKPTYHVVQVPASQNYSGLPDLVATITSVGYLRNSGDTSSFTAANTVPSGYQGAVRFVVANRGTNVSGSWNFEANLPGAGNQSDYTSNSEQSLNPGDSIVFTLGFDSTTRGSDTVRVQADANNRVNESNENNNTASASIYLNGSSNSNSGSYDSNNNYCSNGTYYSNGRYYCNSSNNSNNGNNSSYDSNGNYCRYGTYYQSGRYYCETSNNSNNSSSNYDSNGYYCQYGTYYSNGRYYCDSSSNSNNNNSNNYDSNGNFCSYGTYYQNGRYYCN